MYNLNYNILNCRLNRPVGRPFVPYGRPDPYSSSLILAMPCSIFRAGYVNVFNQVNPWDDISGYLRGGSVFNYDTGQYSLSYPNTTLTPIIPNPDAGFITASFDLIKFQEDGYESSLIVSGNAAFEAFYPETGSGEGFQLSKDKAWTIEGFFAYNVTASAYVSSSGSVIYYGEPNKPLINKYTTGPTPTSYDYIAYTGFSGKLGNPEAPDSFLLVSGSPAFYYDDNRHAGNPDERINTSTSSLIVPFQWQHTAISCTPSQSIDPPFTTGVVRFYVNGNYVGGGNITTNINYSPQTVVEILGNPNPYTGSVINAMNNTNFKTGSGLFVQDFRVYNGSNKNYTGSIIPIPDSMIVGIQEPYPQYNP